jgi:hypothetical protein
MNKRRIKTDNSYFITKVNLRLRHLPKKDEIKVLDCFAGESKIWKSIKKTTNKRINVIGIDKKKYNNTLKGDNVKYLKALNLNKYDVIDLDAYGIPFKQLEIIFQKKYKGKVFITFIQSIFGQLPEEMLLNLGYTKSMIKKCPTLFNLNGLEKFKLYLAKRGIKRIYSITKKYNKHYIYTCIE